MGLCSVQTFGVGDGWPCEDRNHTSTLVDLGEERFLIDCGESLGRSYKSLGLDYDFLDRVFISHYHFDHVGGFFMFIQGCWLEKRKRDLRVHAPVDGLDLLPQLLTAGCVFKELLHFNIHYHPLENVRPIEWGRVRVTPVLTTHLKGLQSRFQNHYPHHSFQAFGFLIEKPGLRIAYSADLGSPGDLDPLLEQPVDLLVCELAHFSLEDIASYLKTKKIRRLCFNHIGRVYHKNQDETRKRLEILLGRQDFKLMQDHEKISFEFSSQGDAH